jgi:hypothetical protein
VAERAGAREASVKDKPRAGSIVTKDLPSNVVPVGNPLASLGLSETPGTGSRIGRIIASRGGLRPRSHPTDASHRSASGSAVAPTVE